MDRLILLMITLATCKAVTNVQLYSNRNASSHCAGTLVSRNAVLTLADCLYNATSKKQLPMLRVGNEMVTRTKALPEWIKNTRPEYNFALAFIGSGRSFSSATDVMWSPYTKEEMSCVKASGTETCPKKKGDRDSLMTANGTVVELANNNKLSPGTAITMDNGAIFALTLKCDSGWKKKKDNCGLRLSKKAFDFICNATDNQRPGCKNHILKHGTDENPVLLQTREEYERVISLPSVTAVILIFCEATLCTTGSCSVCKACTTDRAKNFDSLDRIVGFHRKGIIIRRIDLQKVPIDVPYIPYVIIRPKNQNSWFQFRGALSRLIAIALNDKLDANRSGILKLKQLPDIIPQRVKRGNILSGGSWQCEGNAAEFVKDPVGFAAKNVMIVNHIGALRGSDRFSFTMFPFKDLYIIIGDGGPRDEVFKTLAPTDIGPARFLAYYVPFKRGKNNSISQLPYVDIPEYAAHSEPKFLITDALSGCGVVAERRENGARIYHDNNCEQNAPAWRNRDILAQILAKDYCHDDSTLEECKVLAMVFLYYSNKMWYMVGQCHTQRDIGRQPTGTRSRFLEQMDDMFIRSARPRFYNVIRRVCPNNDDRPDGLIVRQINF